MNPSFRPPFWRTLPATLIVWASLGVVEWAITSRAPGHGVIPFEMVWTAAGAEDFLAPLCGEVRGLLGFSLGLDYLFLMLYGVTLWSGALAVTERWRRRGGGGWPLVWGPGVAIGALVAAVCDSFENAFLLAVLAGNRGWCAFLGSAFASIKFVCFAASVLFIIAVATRTLFLPRPAAAPKAP